MRRYLVIVILTWVTAGCATLAGPGGIFHKQSLELKLSKAVSLQKQGDSAAAADLLAEICADKPVQGVTDEALFRLSLLRLGRGEVEQTVKDLKHLTSRYPASTWAMPAANLTLFLASVNDTPQPVVGMDEETSTLELQRGVLNEMNLALNKRMNSLKEVNLSQKKELAALKESNHALAQENRELRQTIEKLKAVELELRAVPKH